VNVAPPGYYPAQGDPSGTVRYWDGTEWSAEPMPPPPGYDPNRSADNDRYARAWIRIGSNFLDGLVTIAISLPFLVPYIRDVIDDIDAGGDGSSIGTPAALYFVAALIVAVMIATTAIWGATPGKLMVGLRVTKEDSVTTPPGIEKAALRSTPALFGLIPVLGPAISIGLAIASLIMVNTDSERRSAYDRIAGTRVVYKRFL
jgi:uncharacterized RDD family membrane protein YckC